VNTQGSLPTEEAALVLLFSLVASGQIQLRKIDGWRKIGAVLSHHTAAAGVTIIRAGLAVALALALLASPLACFAQQQRSTVARIGLLESSSASSSANLRKALIAGLRELGLVEGKNILIEYRWADGKYERLPGLAAEMVQIKVDVIVAGGTPAVQAAKQATTTIPIIMVRTGAHSAAGSSRALPGPGETSPVCPMSPQISAASTWSCSAPWFPNYRASLCS
jgi:hypothetical protein